MIQQIIGIQDWHVLQSLILRHWQLPLIHHQFDQFASQLSIETISQQLRALDQGEAAIGILEHDFSACYCPDHDIEMAQFFHDFAQLNLPQGHTLLLLAPNMITSEEFNRLLSHLRQLEHHYTLLCLNDSLNPILGGDYEAFRFENHCVATFHVSDERQWLKVVTYQVSDHQLADKVISLTGEAPKTNIANPLPTFIATEAASLAFIDEHRYQPIESVAALRGRLMVCQQAVAVLSAANHNDLITLAEQVNDLKHRFGAELRIIIKEIKPCIRYPDFHLLINSGVQAIVDHRKSEGQLYDQIQLAYRCEMAHFASQVSELVAQYHVPFSQTGRLEFGAFKALIADAIDTLDSTQLEYALVELIPFSSIDIAHAAHYCHMRRQGDVYTQADGRLLLFFPSLRRADLHQALAHAFDVKIADLFANQHFYLNKNAILEQLATINHVDKRWYQETQNDNSSAEPQVTRYAKKIAWDEV
ncbi:hypothetical protein HGP28_03150 [Vibrio sp. SM6]|uniref:Cellulose biosynthesis protein BcsE n=1 Tax=Vibrio agarilyticus TaxID=2726741 RepID=A0A7X8YFG3_9VIBR|nr:BcsE family c-di-GMP-binding protein [Vibrio agarilyticus]NLS11888.1 hypothetical protein [Vibrio agarilyticus]